MEKTWAQALIDGDFHERYDRLDRKIAEFFSDPRNGEKIARWAEGLRRIEEDRYRKIIDKEVAQAQGEIAEFFSEITAGLAGRDLDRRVTVLADANPLTITVRVGRERIKVDVVGEMDPPPTLEKIAAALGGFSEHEIESEREAIREFCAQWKADRAAPPPSPDVVRDAKRMMKKFMRRKHGY